LTRLAHAGAFRALSVPFQLHDCSKYPHSNICQRTGTPRTRVRTSAMMVDGRPLFPQHLAQPRGRPPGSLATHTIVRARALRHNAPLCHSTNGSAKRSRPSVEHAKTHHPAFVSAQHATPPRRQVISTM
jgi:hypothetical protein